MNLYGFASADPINLSDPFGLSDCEKQWTEECDKPLESPMFDPVAFVSGFMPGLVRGLFVRATAAAVPTVSNRALQNTMRALFSPGDKVAGGTAGAIRQEAMTGAPVGGRFHLQKGMERIRNLENILERETLSAADRVAAERVLADLRSAVRFAQEQAKKSAAK
jgi:hypothetical protein